MSNSSDQTSAATKRQKATKASKQNTGEVSNRKSPDESSQQNLCPEPNQAELFPRGNQQNASKTPKNQSGKNLNAQAQRDELLAPTAPEFKELCQLAHKTQQLKPWTFMDETDVFGVQDPDTGEIGFVSVMGALGEYEAVAVYRGSDALYAWRDFEAELESNPQSEQAREMFFEIPQLHLAFESGPDLEKRDREVIKNSGLKFGRKKPAFRCYRPGYLAWFLTQTEARQLIHTLTQMIDVAERFSFDESVIRFTEGPEDNDFLLRVPKSQDSELVWQDQINTMDPPVRNLVPFKVDDSVLSTLRALPKSGTLEIDLFTLPARVGGPNERPRLLYALFAADAASGVLLGFELLEAANGIDLLYASIPERLAEVLTASRTVPEDFWVRSTKLYEVLGSFVNDLGSDLFATEELPAVDQAKSFLFKSMKLGS